MVKEQLFKIAGIGEILWDLLPSGKQLGGAPANFAFHAQQLGAKSTVVSSVGNDAPGNEILERLRSLNLCTDFIQSNQHHPTGVVDVQLTDGNPSYTIKTGVAWDYIVWETSLAALAMEADAVCFGTLAQRNEMSRQTIHQFLKQTRPECLRVFDINLRQNFYSKEIIAESLRLASVLKLNDEELPVVAEIFSIEGSEIIVLKSLMVRFGLRLIALTKGSRGSLLLTDSRQSFLEVPAVEVKDTVGAGDAFTAAMIVAILSGLPLARVHRIANEVAAFVCLHQGATPLLNKEKILEQT